MELTIYQKEKLNKTNLQNKTSMIKLIEGDRYEGQIEFSNSGNASITIEEKSIFIHRKNTLNSLHLDKVKIEIFKGEKKLEAKVVETISRFRTEFVGRVQIGKKSTFVISDSDKISVDFYIKGGLVAKDGQKVIVELIKWEDSKSPQGKIIKVLGDSGDNNAEMNSIMFEYSRCLTCFENIHHSFGFSQIPFLFYEIN